MNKNIFDEAKETLLGVGTTFIAVPCNPIGEENSDMIHLRDATPDYGRAMIKVSRALELGKLYQRLYQDYDNLTMNEELDIIKQIKELENDTKRRY